MVMIAHRAVLIYISLALSYQTTDMGLVRHAFLSVSVYPRL